MTCVTGLKGMSFGSDVDDVHFDTRPDHSMCPLPLLEYNWLLRSQRYLVLLRTLAIQNVPSHQKSLHRRLLHLPWH